MRRAIFLAEFAFLTAGVKTAAAAVANHFVIAAVVAGAVMGSISTSPKVPSRHEAREVSHSAPILHPSAAAENDSEHAEDRPLDDHAGVPVEDLTLELDDEQSPTTSRFAPQKRVDLSFEIRMLDQARTALRANNPTQAIALLGQYLKRYPKGAFRQEAAVLRIEALAVAGSRGRAASEAARFIAKNPRSPHVEKLKRLLGE
jgi:TolA-binding protein